MADRWSRFHHQMWLMLHIGKDRWWWWGWWGWQLWYRNWRRLGCRLEFELGRVRWSSKGGRKARVGFGVCHPYPQEMLVVIHDGDTEPTAAVVARNATP